MSKGHGTVQRGILEVFAANPDELLDSFEIAGLILGRGELTHSEYESVRRALQKIVSEGRLVDMGRHWRYGRRRYALPDCAKRYHDRVKAVFG